MIRRDRNRCKILVTNSSTKRLLHKRSVFVFVCSLNYTCSHCLHRFRSYKSSRLAIVEPEIRGNQITTRSDACILSRTNTVFVSRSVIDLATPGRQKESFRARYYVQRYRRKYFFSHRSFGPPPASIDVSFVTSRGAENAHTFPFFSFFFFCCG